MSDDYTRGLRDALAAVRQCMPTYTTGTGEKVELTREAIESIEALIFFARSTSRRNATIGVAAIRAARDEPEESFEDVLRRNGIKLDRTPPRRLPDGTVVIETRPGRRAERRGNKLYIRPDDT